MIRRPPRSTLFPYPTLSRSKPEQVALMRARWEREKRKLKEAPAAPKRRRAVKAAEPVAVLPEARPKRRRRTAAEVDRKSTRLNSSHGYISYAVFCLKKKKIQ